MRTRTVRRAKSVKAIQFDRFGGSEVLEVRDIEMPEPKPGKVRIIVQIGSG